VAADILTYYLKLAVGVAQAAACTAFVVRLSA